MYSPDCYLYRVQTPRSAGDVPASVYNIFTLKRKIISVLPKVKNRSWSDRALFIIMFAIHKAITFFISNGGFHSKNKK